MVRAPPSQGSLSLVGHRGLARDPQDLLRTASITHDPSTEESVGDDVALASRLYEVLLPQGGQGRLYRGGSTQPVPEAVLLGVDAPVPFRREGLQREPLAARQILPQERESIVLHLEDSAEDLVHQLWRHRLMVEVGVRPGEVGELLRVVRVAAGDVEDALDRTLRDPSRSGGEARAEKSFEDVMVNHAEWHYLGHPVQWLIAVGEHLGHDVARGAEEDVADLALLLEDGPHGRWQMLLEAHDLLELVHK